MSKRDPQSRNKFARIWIAVLSCGCTEGFDGPLQRGDRVICSTCGEQVVETVNVGYNIPRTSETGEEFDS